MTKTIDFTKMRKGSKYGGRPIDYCPKCGRKGQKTSYGNGDAVYVHSGSVVMGFLTVGDSCTFKAVTQ